MRPISHAPSTSVHSRSSHRALDPVVAGNLMRIGIPPPFIADVIAMPGSVLMLSRVRIATEGAIRNFFGRQRWFPRGTDAFCVSRIHWRSASCCTEGHVSLIFGVIMVGTRRRALTLRKHGYSLNTRWVTGKRRMQERYPSVAGGYLVIGANEARSNSAESLAVSKPRAAERAESCMAGTRQAWKEPASVAVVRTSLRPQLTEARTAPALTVNACLRQLSSPV